MDMTTKDMNPLSIDLFDIFGVKTHTRFAYGSIKVLYLDMS